MGLVFLNNIDRVNQNTEFGYYIGEKKYIGTGISIETELLILEYAFDVQNMHKVYCESLDYNKSYLDT